MSLADRRRGKSFLRARTGDDSQIAGVRRFRMDEGRAGGASFAEVRTATGLSFTVALDRALDISDAFYKGKSLCWRSPAGDAHPGLYDPQGLGWLKTFFGGLLTTCGLTHTGAPADVGGKHYGLHGPISNTPGEEIGCRSEWEGDNLVMEVSGKVRQGVLFGEKLILHRTISASAFEKRIVIRDIVENTSAERSELAVMYHCNVGYPVLEEGSRLLVKTELVEPADAQAAGGIEEYAVFGAPEKGCVERCYYITPKANRRGENTIAVINAARDFGLYLSWRAENLPGMVEWKMMGVRDYVLGVEPCTVFDRPREDLLRRKEMPYLGAGQSRELGLEIGVIEGREEVRAISKKIGGR